MKTYCDSNKSIEQSIIKDQVLFKAPLTVNTYQIHKVLLNIAKDEIITEAILR